MNCHVSGDPFPSIFWSRSGLNSIVATEERLKNNSTEFVIDKLLKSDLGTYKCTARNRAGNVAESFNIFVEDVLGLYVSVCKN